MSLTSTVFLLKDSCCSLLELARKGRTLFSTQDTECSRDLRNSRSSGYCRIRNVQKTFFLFNLKLSLQSICSSWNLSYVYNGNHLHSSAQNVKTVVLAWDPVTCFNCWNGFVSRHLSAWECILRDNLFLLNLSSHPNNIICLSVFSEWLLCLACKGLEELMQCGYGYAYILTLWWRWILSLPWKIKALSAVSMTATLTSDPLREENSSDWTYTKEQ